MNIKDKDPFKDELEFVIKGFEKERLDSNHELTTITLVRLLSNGIFYLRENIEDPEKKYITWDNPHIELIYTVEFPNNESDLPLIIWPGQTSFQRRYVEPLSILLREMTDYVVVFKQGDKTWGVVNSQNRHLKKLTEAERKRRLEELGEKYFSDNRESTARVLDFKLELPGDKEPKRKTLKGSILLDVRPLFADLDSGESHYTVTTRLDIKGYTHINWSKEEKEEFWDALEKELKTLIPQKSFDFIDKLPIEPEVKPVIKDKGYVVEVPKNLADTTQIVFTNIGVGDHNFKGYTNEGGRDNAKWQGEGVAYLVPTEDLPLLSQRKKKHEGQGYLIPIGPKNTVGALKSLHTLCYMLQEENRKRDRTGQDKTGNLEFSLKEYAKIRGKSDAQIARGGGILDELKRDLISVGITSYIVDLEELVGRKSYLIQNFYGLEVPKAKSKEKWRVFFNEPHKTNILNNKQYFAISLDAIQDPKTNGKKGYLYYFYTVVTGYANTKTKFKTQLKVSTLLNYIKAGDRTKDIPKEAFKVLCECIYYTATNRNGVIKEVWFFNNGRREKEKLITDLERFAKWDYNDFKNEILNGLGLTDIREALISFNHTPQKEVTEEPKQYGEDKEIF